MELTQNDFIYVDDELQIRLIENSSKNVELENYSECRYGILNQFINPEHRKTGLFYEFSSRNSYCPHIQKSCCTHEQIDYFALELMKSAKKFRTIFGRISQVTKMYYKKGKMIKNILNFFLNIKNHNCSSFRSDEVYQNLNSFLDQYYDQSDIVDEYLNYIMEIQSGYICQLCDLRYNRYYYFRDNRRKILNYDQCRKSFTEYYIFLEVVVQMYKLATVVNVLQCNFYSNKEYTLLIDFRRVFEEYKKVSKCFDQYNDPKLYA